MAFQDWIRHAKARYANLDFTTATHLNIKETESRLLRFPLNWWGDRIQRTPVFDEDWELLIVLDTCRVDALELLSHEFDYLQHDIPAFNSVGQTSYLWMERNFISEYSEEMARTAHITWNPHSDNELDAEEWLALDEVWRDWPNDLRYLPAAQVTDHAVETYADTDAQKMIVHYMQPHEPYPGLDVNDEYVPEDVLDGKDNTTVFDLMKLGELGADVVWFYYINTLRRVLEEIRRLVGALPYTDVVLTADHGETFGRYGFYGHPGSVTHPDTIRVPWLHLDTETISDTGLTDQKSKEPTEVSAEDRLQQLGYLN
jgi:hypothetical protein